jgi:metal-responsive CopG/Arc/MetJ family transcriptional regulator
MKRELKPFLCRLDVDVVKLLDQASTDRKKSRAELINEAVRVYLNADLNTRLDRVVVWR